MYASISQFLWCLTKLVEGQTMEKTELWQQLWLKIELFSRLCQGTGNGSFGLTQKNSVLHRSHIMLILQKINFSI
jgi:hypothetical protein